MISALSQCGSSCGSRCEGSVSPPTPPGPWPTSLCSSLGQLFPASRGRTGSITPGLEAAGTGHHHPGKLAARPGPGCSAGLAEHHQGADVLLWTRPAPKGGQAGEPRGPPGPHPFASSYFLRVFIYTVPSVYITTGLQHFFPLSGIFQ